MEANKANKTPTRPAAIIKDKNWVLKMITNTPPNDNGEHDQTALYMPIDPKYLYPDTNNWHTISMTTKEFDALPGDSVFVQLYPK